MLSPQEREQYKRITFAKKTPENEKEYAELYSKFYRGGYTKQLAVDYAGYFVDNAKKPAIGDILQTVRLYDRLHDYKVADLYLSRIEENVKKLTSEEKFQYCVASLLNKSKIGNWRDAEDFRTENINFMQIHSEKVDLKQKSAMYIALAYADCAAKHYTSAFRLLKGFGYKPQGKNDEILLEILIAGIYICARSGDEASVQNSVENAHSALKLFNKFEFDWSKGYYQQRIAEAAEGIV